MLAHDPYSFDGGDKRQVGRGTCVGKEERAFVPLTMLAKETMKGVPHRLTEYNSCELDGYLDPAMIAEVPEWHESPATRNGTCWTSVGRRNRGAGIAAPMDYLRSSPSQVSTG